MPKHIIADGKSYVVPDDATDDEINQIVGPGSAAAPPAAPAAPSDTPPAYALRPWYENAAIGVAKHEGNNLLNIDDAVSKIPVIGKWMTTPLVGDKSSEQARADLKANTQLEGMAQKVGAAAGAVGDYLIPAGVEAKAAGAGAKLLPFAGRMAAPLARVGASAATGAAVNKLQGGTATGGAIAGAGGGAVGEGLRYIAPMIAESALSVRAPDRAYGRTPGQAILDETGGVRPGTIADQARGKVSLYTGELEDGAQNAKQPVDLQPARDTQNSFMNTARLRNNPDVVKEVGKIGDQLQTRNGVPIPQFVPAEEGLALRRGIDDLQSSFNPATAKDFTSRAVDATRGAMGDELEKVIPDYRNLNQRISTLLPVAQRAGAADLNANAVHRMVNRLRVPTGAMTLPIAGAVAGGAHGGPLQAAVGGAATLAAQEILGSPTVQMAGARLFNTPVPAKAATAAGLFLAPKRR